MEENKEDIVQNNEESIETEAEDMKPADDSALDDDIQYTFVVPRGEIYVDPDLESSEPDADAAEEDTEDPAAEALEGDIELSPAAKTIVADHRQFTDAVNEGLADEDVFLDTDDDLFRTYMAADPVGRTAVIDPPVYGATGLPDDEDDITYTFVVPKGEVYKEPDPEEELAAKQVEKARRAALAEETKVMERKSAADESAEKTHYGLPAGHPEMGELAQKQEARRIYKQRKKNRFRTRFYVGITIIVLAIGWLIISNSGLFIIDAIEVQGNSHYTAEEIINMGHASPGRNIIYKANIKETKEYLENNPYIKRAEIKRRLPSTLVIKVNERQERMAFKYDDDYLVMDEDGVLLRKTRSKPKITIIKGLVVSKIKLGEKIGTDNESRMDKAIALIKTMISADLYYVNVDISKEKKVNAYIYDTLVVKADYDTLMTNMENGRLHLVVEKLFEDGIERGTITFREDGTASFVPTF